MLVLSRKSGETLVIGENIVLKVIEIRSGRVRLSLDAPRDVRILRSELRPRLDAVSTAKTPDEIVTS